MSDTSFAWADPEFNLYEMEDAIEDLEVERIPEPSLSLALFSLFLVGRDCLSERAS